MWTSQVYGHHDKMARTKTHRTSQNTEYTKTQQTLRITIFCVFLDFSVFSVNSINVELISSDLVDLPHGAANVIPHPLVRAAAIVTVYILEDVFVIEEYTVLSCCFRHL